MIEQVQIILKKYLTHFPEENERFEILKNQLRQGEDITSRKNFHGHVTASGLVLSSNNQALVIFHNKLQKYLQPGGHLELNDANLIESAKREIKEETGLQNIVLHPWCEENELPIFIDTHRIPENKNKNEEQHYHHDHLFVFYTKDDEIFLDRNEVSDFKWIDINILLGEDSLISRAIKKMNEKCYGDELFKK